MSNAALSPTSPTRRWPSTGVTLSTIAGDAQGLSTAAFEEAWGRGFFVRHALSSRTRLAPMRTALHLDDDDGGPAERTGEIVLMVMPVLRGPQSEHPFVSIGRVDGNDICIADETLSKFHAFVREADGSFLLQDARSRNGTTVDGQPVAPRGMGEPTPLRTGTVVRFGSVTASFLDAAALIALARRHAS